MNKLTHTPDGLSDMLVSEYKQKKEIETKAVQVFEKYGYTMVQTPTFEFGDLYDVASTLPTEQIFKFFDNDGRTLSLRPDITTSIARIAATKLKDAPTPLRLSYIGSSFRNDEAYSSARQREFTQMGIELLGDDSNQADAEVIKIAIETLKAAGLKKFKIDIGHIGFFNGLVDEAGLDNAAKAELQRIFERKDATELTKFLDDCKVSGEINDIISEAPFMFGDTAVIENILNKFPEINVKSRAALENLQAVCKILEKAEYADYLSIDLGMVPNLDYYTGIIIKGFTCKVGFPLVSGGRYDTLTEKFGKKMPATGISIAIERVMTALSSTFGDTDDEYVTIALAKGRLAEFAMDLFAKAGYDVAAMREKSRKLIFEDAKNKLKFILVKAGDVPTYVEYGAADIGIVGKDTIMEEGKRIYELNDLGFGRCKMSVCGKNAQLLNEHGVLRVATKYTAIAKDYFHNKKGRTVDIIKLNGSVELGPLIELSDVIVDIVESGKTLEENGLKVLEDICDLSARVVVNRVSVKMKREKVLGIIGKLEKALI
ncbi:MAG: ATP phosphoribosyltransferase regulatory subunit [Oscillospiraceae bacterium]|nr:ATP phosphoribosyltransferase regulatory subunit [Oscillospiraceae bacterium]